MEWETGCQVNAEWEVQWVQAWYTNIWHVLDKRAEIWGDGKVVLLLDLELPYGGMPAGAMPAYDVAFLGYWSVFAFERSRPFYWCIRYWGEYPCSRNGQIGLLIHEMLHLYGYGHDDYSIMSTGWASWPNTRLPDGVENSDLFR